MKQGEVSSGGLARSIKKILSFYMGSEKTSVISLIVIAVILGTIPSVDSLLLKNLIDKIQSLSNDIPGSSLASSIILWGLVYAVWWESINILMRVYDYIHLKCMPTIKANIIDEFYDYIQYHSNDFFQENMAGDVTNRVIDGSKAIEMIFYYFNDRIIRKLAMIIFALTTLYSVHIVVGNIFSVWLILFVGISLFFSKSIDKLSTDFNEKRALVAGKIVDSISNISVIRMFTSHKYERRYLNKFLSAMVSRDRNMQFFMLKLSYILGFITSVMIFFMIYYVINLKIQNLISTGDCVLVVTLCVSLVDDIWDLSEEFGDLFEQVGAFSLALSLVEQHMIRDVKDAKELVVDNATIEFKNVTFRYKFNEKIFNNKSVIIPASQKVGLVGFSGSGKTTFTKLIARLHDIEEGEILIGGQDIKLVKQDSLRQHISIIPQEPIMFHRTILENIKYGNETASMTEVIEATKAAYIHNEIEKMPEGYNTLCGERGNNLSIGQKQRIIIARAILKNAPILILDEATSALDSHTENLIQKSMQTLMQGKTVLVIAHRLSTLLDMERILVFHNGDIVEDGTHQNLRTNGRVYQRLWETQAQGFV